MPDKERKCPQTGLICYDRYCEKGCQLAGSDVEPLIGFQSQCPITGKNGTTKEIPSAEK